jgi:hypothetical protein
LESLLKVIQSGAQSNIYYTSPAQMEGMKAPALQQRTAGKIS